MPRSTGRIRAEDLDHEAVTSRTFARTIQSDNFIEGVSGWRLQRDTGDFEANDGTFRGDLLVQGDTGITVSGGGDITIKSGGDLVIAGGQIIVQDSAGAELVTLDEDGLDIGSGKVTVDDTGLTVDGGVVQAVWVTSAEDAATDVTITTSSTQVCSITIDPPDWVEQVTVFGFARLTVNNFSGSEILYAHALSLDNGGAAEDNVSTSQDVPNGRNSNTMLVEEATFALSPAGRSFDITQTASLSAGSHGDNAFSIKVFVFGVRSAFT